MTSSSSIIRRRDLTPQHPHHQLMSEPLGPWERYRAFGGGMITAADKMRWLPQGKQESDASYAVRIKLSHDIGWSTPAIRRMRGTLTKDGPAIDHGETPAAIVEQLELWLNNVDGNNHPLSRWWAESYADVLRMGIDIVEVVRDPSDAPSLADEPMPYLHCWRAEEAVSWSVDKRGALEWIVLQREEIVPPSPLQTATTRTILRVLTRTTGQQWRVEEDERTGEAQLVPHGDMPEWEHNLGVVPVVPRYAFRMRPMQGRSYIDEISLGDWRKLQLESDQAMASYMHGSPQLLIRSKQDLENLGVGVSAFIKLDVDDSAEYLALETAGMTIREQIIERTARESLNSAGIDPAGVATAEGVAARASGAALAWSFSTSEEPTLNSLVAEMDSADEMLLEIVARYLTPGEARSPYERVYLGTAQRPRRWDLLAPSQLIEQAIAAFSIVPSPTFRREIAKQVGDRMMVGASTDTRAQVSDELDSAQYGDPADDLAQDGAETDLDNSDEDEGTGDLAENTER